MRKAVIATSVLWILACGSQQSGNDNGTEAGASSGGGGRSGASSGAGNEGA